MPTPLSPELSGPAPRVILSNRVLDGAGMRDPNIHSIKTVSMRTCMRVISLRSHYLYGQCGAL